MENSNYSISYIRQATILSAFLCLILVSFSCNNFLEVDVNKSEITKDLVFDSDATANAAMNGIYTDMLTGTNFANGGISSIMTFCGLSADEFNYYLTNPTYQEYELNSLTSANSGVLSLWQSMYNTIYQSNSLLEGIEASTTISDSLRNQLRGEALFIRAFSHFYLVNLYGDIPWIETTNYQENAMTSRKSMNEIYGNLIADLTESKDLLNDEYVTGERIRPNKGAASALLSRVYLYTEDWQNAVNEASELLGNSLYSLPLDLNDAFVHDSQEAIWQLKPMFTLQNTNEGKLLILNSAPGFSNPIALSQEVIDSFEPGDTRLLNWVNSITSGTDTYYFAHKYKEYLGPDNGVPLNEYSMVLRLAEQYLVRAEADAHLGNLSSAINDIDVLRERAGLPLIADTNPGINQADLLLAVEQERRVEFFAEWGHRWIDLKRTGRATQIFQSLKPDWNSSDELYPIPQSELNNNPQLGSQNPGY